MIEAKKMEALFKQGVLGVFRQGRLGRLSERAGEGCTYYFRGTRCVIGHMLPEETARFLEDGGGEGFEGAYSVEDQRERIVEAFGTLSDADVKLFGEIQNAHDLADNPSDMLRRLERLGDGIDIAEFPWFHLPTPTECAEARNRG